jgi:hypothetical protein
MNDERTSWGCLGATIVGSLVALLAIADLLIGFELIPGIGLGRLLAGLIELVGRVIETLTRPF